MWRLKIGNKLTGFTVRPDERWPSMWRVHAPDGTVSDMVNVTRAKDAAFQAAQRSEGGKRTANWERVAPQKPA